MNLPGLYHQAARLIFSASAAAADARRPSKDPHTAYELGLSAERLEKEAHELRSQAQGNLELMESLQPLIHYLASSKHKSRYRSLALTDLESSVNWLQRENGTPV